LVGVGSEKLSLIVAPRGGVAVCWSRPAAPTAPSDCVHVVVAAALDDRPSLGSTLNRSPSRF
jgi:hypothetical protein